jgi:hypothetical protein
LKSGAPCGAPWTDDLAVQPGRRQLHGPFSADASPFIFPSSRCRCA